MGESTPQVNPLTDPRAGSISLADWLNLSRITPALANQLNLLVPSQEMRPFQRSVRTQEIPAAVAVGEVPLFQARVPDDEAWRLHWMTYFHNDSEAHIVRLTFSPRLEQPDSFMTIARQQIAQDIDSPIYPSMPTTIVTNSQFNQRGGEQPEFFPGDLLLFTDESVRVDVVAGIARLMFRYELIPLPVSMARDRVWTLNVI